MKVLFILPIFTLFSVNNGDIVQSFRDLGIDEIQYRFHDSSVPPPYHRSYTITIKSDSVHILVDSYGSVISDKTFVISADSLNKLIALLDEAKIRNGKLDDNTGCTGGTSESIKCFSKGNMVFSGSVYHCGGKDSGDLGGEVSIIAEYARNLIPDFEKVLDRK
jgi:hypothetical protein